MFFQDLEGVCREAGKQAHDWAASVRSMAELADQTGYEPSSGHNRSLVAIIAEKRERRRCVSWDTSRGDFTVSSAYIYRRTLSW